MAPNSKPITEINRTTIRQIADEADAALSEVAERLGLTLEKGGGRFDPATGTFTPKFTFSLPDAARRAWDQTCYLFDLGPEDFGATIRMKGQTFTLTGINTRARSMPITAESGGKGYKFPVATVKALLAAERANGARS